MVKKDGAKRDEVMKYRVGRTKSSVEFVHPKIRRFITADPNNESIISIDDKKIIAILEGVINVSEI